jgi:hypothetical protein
MRLSSICVAAQFLLAACSSLSQSPVSTANGPIRRDQTYVLAVQTGNPAFDKLLYEHCYREFSKTLPIVESGAYTGVVEVSFVTSGQGYTMQTTNSYSSASTQGWFSGYSGYGYATASGTTTGITTGSVFQWQNSTMLVVVRNHGNRVWSADYQYKGGWELSGFYVNTPDEAARLCARRLGEFMAGALGHAQ